MASRALDERVTEKQFNLIKFLLAIGFIFVVLFQLTHLFVHCTDCRDKFLREEGFGLNLQAIRQDLVFVSESGPHFAGSTTLETRITDFLRGRIQDIKPSASSGISFKFDEQISREGSYSLGPVILAYKNVRNLLLRISHSKNSTGKAILLNCHYDSAVSSPAASDVFVACAIQLEIARLFATGQFSLNHDLILLFNGAEESILITSHAFVTQHPWAKDVLTFVNSEGAGAGGRAFLFQTGPGKAASRLTRTYAKVAVNPLCSVVAEEIFQRGLIPSDTDFRQFRDYGRIPGMDMAYTTEGYAYHTPYDTENRILDSCISLATYNLFKLAKVLVTDVEFPSFTMDRRPQDTFSWNNLVFFDLFGQITLVYSAQVQLWMHAGLIFTLLVCWLVSRVRPCLLLRTVLLQILWLGLLLGLSLGLAWLVHNHGSRMSFYNFRYNALMLYLNPLIVASLVFYDLLRRWVTCDSLFVSSCGILLALASTCLHLGLTAVVYFHWSLIPAFLVYLLGRAKWQSLLFHVLIILAGSAFVMNIVMVLVDTLIPMMGRSGTAEGVKPDLIMAVLVLMGFLLPGFFGAPLVVRTSSKSIRVSCFFAVQFVFSSVLLVNFTKTGFPYGETQPYYHMPSDHPPSFRHQRVNFVHVESREVHDCQGKIIHKDSGLLIQPMDTNGARLLAREFRPLTGVEPYKCDVSLPYCGMPQLRAWEDRFPENYYLTNSAELFNSKSRLTTEPNFAVNIKELEQNNLYNISVQVTPGHAHSVVNLRLPMAAMIMIGSSFQNGPLLDVPMSKPDLEARHYFISHLNQVQGGFDPKASWNFWFSVMTRKISLQQNSTFQMSLSTKIFEPQDSIDKFMIQQQLPKWVARISWAATYKSFCYALNTNM